MVVTMFCFIVATRQRLAVQPSGHYMSDVNMHAIFLKALIYIYRNDLVPNFNIKSQLWAKRRYNYIKHRLC